MNQQQYYRGSSRPHGFQNRRQALKKRRRRIVIAAAAILVVAVGGTVLFSHLLTTKATDPTNTKPDGTTASTVSTSSVQSSSEPASSVPKAVLTADTSFAQWNQTCDWTMVMVNAYNPIPDDWEDHIIYPPGYSPCGMDDRILKPIQDMINAAYADNVSLWISSGYRSKEKQASLLEQEIQTHMNSGMDRAQAEVEAKKLVMPAGYSEHQSGLVIDINGVDPDFYQTKAYEWMTQHAAEYGFIERYPDGKSSITGIDYEPWHYRYVGVDNAKAIQASGLCLEEYIFQQMNS